MVREHRAFFRNGPPFPPLSVRSLKCQSASVQHEFDHRPHVGRGILVEKHRRVSRQGIVVILLGQEIQYDQIVAENSRASLRCATRLGDFIAEVFPAAMR